MYDKPLTADENKDLTACSDVITEGRRDQTRTLFQAQATELRDQQEVEGGPRQLLPSGQQLSQLLDQLTRCIRRDQKRGITRCQHLV